MAVRFNENNDGLTSTVGMPGTSFTVTCWAVIRVDRNDYSNVWAYQQSDNTREAALATGPDGTTANAYDNNLAGPAGANMAVGVWYRTAVTVSGTTATLYMAAEGAPSLTLTTVTNFRAPAAPLQLWVARQNTGPYYLDGAVASLKSWSAVLTQTEIEAELGQYAGARTLNLLRNHTFIDGSLLDSSGNARHLTAGSTATTTEAGPATLDGAGGTSFGTGFFAA